MGDGTKDQDSWIRDPQLNLLTALEANIVLFQKLVDRSHGEHMRYRVATWIASNSNDVRAVTGLEDWTFNDEDHTSPILLQGKLEKIQDAVKLATHRTQKQFQLRWAEWVNKTLQR